MRNLASIQKIVDIQPIEGADKIECVQILGWKLVAKKNEFKIGELCVYIEIDSILPKIAAFEFMANYKYRVKTIRLRKQISQGLAVNLKNLPEFKLENLKEGTDVTDILDVKKYDPDQAAEDKIVSRSVNKWWSPYAKYWLFQKIVLPIILRKETATVFPSHLISKSDETRIQNIPKILAEYDGKVFIETEKLEGQSSTYSLEKKRFGKIKFHVCSREKRLPKRTTSNWWKIEEQLDIQETLDFLMTAYPALAWNIQGEIIGEGIQGNIYNVKGLDFYVYRLKKTELNGAVTFFNPYEGINLLKEFGLKWVPIVGEYVLDKTTVETILKHVDGPSLLNSKHLREGSVFNLAVTETPFSFKAVSNTYLEEKAKKEV